VKGVSTDGGRTCIPDLRKGGAEEVATTNGWKSALLVEEFYPKRSAGAVDPPADADYPEPKWKYTLLSEELLHEVAVKMKPWKATRSGTFPNCVYKFCGKLIIPRLCRIYQALDVSNGLWVS
jgi:hypothetical protein